MSHDNSAIKNKQQKHPKVYFEQYLFNSGEPEDNYSNELPGELTDELIINTAFMKRRIKAMAQRLRARYL